MSELDFFRYCKSIIYQDAVPVFIDSDLETWNMSPDALESAMKKYSKAGKLPKAVIVVHLYGLAANMEKITEICKKYDVPIIEDAAESLGTFYRGQMTGTFGEYGIVSFNGNKIITSSGGGMLFYVTEKVRKTKLKKHCSGQLSHEIRQGIISIASWDIITE